MQAVKETRPMAFPRALSAIEQAQVLEACNKSAVALDMDLAVDSTNITLQGMPNRVRKASVSSRSCLCIIALPRLIINALADSLF